MRFGDHEFVTFLVTMLSLLLWLAWTCFAWRETAAERAERVQKQAGKAIFCPKCGYNMVGLLESRCPECGTAFTLDQLFIAQQRGQIADKAVD